MAELVVRADNYIPEFAALLEKTGTATVFANTLNAIQHIAEMYQQVWISYASGTPIPGAPRIINSAEYARSIMLEDDDPAVKVVYTTSDQHIRIERGSPEVDLKPGLLSGPKARQGKDGPYNIVPFRHMTPGAVTGMPMPANVYRLMLKRSKEADELKAQGLISYGGKSRVIRGSSVPEERIYEWGYRFDRKSQQGRETKRIDSDRTYEHRSGRYAGMVRMDTSSGRARSSLYMTFRTVSFRSDPNSWIIPEKSPIPIRERVVETVDPIAREMLREALEADIS